MALDSGIPDRNDGILATAGPVYNDESRAWEPAKITGFGKGGGHIKAHLDYNSRNGKLELENDRGEVFSSQVRNQGCGQGMGQRVLRPQTPPESKGHDAHGSVHAGRG